MTRRINIGCGPYRIDGNDWVNIDANPRWRPDIVRDIRRGLPFDDSSCGEVLTSHFLEHLASDDLIFLVGEIYRVLAPDGLWKILAPLGCTGDLDHKMIFADDSFDVLLRPESANYYQLHMRWEEVAGSRGIRQEPTRPHIASLHLVLRAVK